MREERSEGGKQEGKGWGWACLVYTYKPAFARLKRKITMSSSPIRATKQDFVSNQTGNRQKHWRETQHCYYYKWVSTHWASPSCYNAVNYRPKPITHKGIQGPVMGAQQEKRQKELDTFEICFIFIDISKWINVWLYLVGLTKGWKPAFSVAIIQTRTAWNKRGKQERPLAGLSFFLSASWPAWSCFVLPTRMERCKNTLILGPCNQNLRPLF